MWKTAGFQQLFGWFGYAATLHNRMNKEKNRSYFIVLCRHGNPCLLCRKEHKKL